MKKYQCKKSLSMVLVFVVMGLCSLGVFFACQISREEVYMVSSSVSVEYQGIDYPLPDNPIVRIDNLYIVKEGEIGWYDTQGKGDPLNVGANFYYLPRDIKNYEEYRKLLERKQEGKLNILKFTIGESGPNTVGIPVIKIELPSIEEVRNIEKVYYGSSTTLSSP